MDVISWGIGLGGLVRDIGKGYFAGEPPGPIYDKLVIRYPEAGEIAEFRVPVRVRGVRSFKYEVPRLIGEWTGIKKGSPDYTKGLVAVEIDKRHPGVDKRNRIEGTYEHVQFEPLPVDDIVTVEGQEGEFRIRKKGPAERYTLLHVPIALPGPQSYVRRGSAGEVEAVQLFVDDEGHTLDISIPQDCYEFHECQGQDESTDILCFRKPRRTGFSVFVDLEGRAPKVIRLADEWWQENR